MKIKRKLWIKKWFNPKTHSLKKLQHNGTIHYNNIMKKHKEIKEAKNNFEEYRKYLTEKYGIMINKDLDNKEEKEKYEILFNEEIKQEENYYKIVKKIGYNPLLIPASNIFIRE